MNRKQTKGIKITLFFLILTGFENSSFAKEPVSNLPNILWLTSEDNSTFLGCYGDKFATTPNLDKLATQGFLYSHCYANAPVCAPARNTIITGVFYAKSGIIAQTIQKPITTQKASIQKRYGTKAVIQRIIKTENRDNLFLLFLIQPFLTKVAFINQFQPICSGTTLKRFRYHPTILQQPK